MARILFVEIKLRNEKLGPMYVSAALKIRGHETLMCWYEKEDVEDRIKSFKPDFLAFSLTTGLHRKIFDIAIRLKKKFKLKVLFGGPHATFFAKNIPDETADIIVVGPGERAAVDVVENRVRRKIITYDLMEPDSIPFPDRKLFYRYDEFKKNPMKNIITMRDCPYSCSYCYNHSWKKMYNKQPYYMKRRSVDNVIDEAKQLKRDYLVDRILFVDDNFIIDEKWIEEFCKKYKQEIDLPFLCSCRVNLLNENKIRMLKEAGLFMANFALESADPDVQKNILNRGSITNEDVINAISLFKKYDIRCRMQNMIGLPLKESFKDAMKTLNFNRQHRVDDSWVSIFQPYPGTELATYSLEKGFIDNNLEQNIADSFFDESHLNIDHKNEIKMLQKWWFYIVKYGFSDRLIDILLKIRISDAIGRALQKLRFKFSSRHLYGIEGDDDYYLTHDWEFIVRRYKESSNFKTWSPIIKKYTIATALSEILMSINVQDEVAKELAKAP